MSPITPVSLSVTFSVTVPPGEAGDYLWVTAVEVSDGFGGIYPGGIYPVVTTLPTQVVTLVEGTQNVTMEAFHTTNGVCYAVHSIHLGMSASLDIQLRTAAFAPFFGKRFPITFALYCV
jgi:hypothetical protein